MRKIYCIIIAVFLLFAMSCYAGNNDFVFYSTKTTTGQITTGTGKYYGVKVNTDGTNAATITLYDGTDATGTVIDVATVYTTSATNRVMASGSNPPRKYYSGLYAVISCAGTVSATFEFMPE